MAKRNTTSKTTEETPEDKALNEVTGKDEAPKDVTTEADETANEEGTTEEKDDEYVAGSPEFAETVTDEDLPNREDAAVIDPDEPDPNRGWTAQQTGYVAPSDTPNQIITKSQLPTEEGLREIGVTNTSDYLASVPVKK